jgi:lambda repressor-like predicted transcriptional regulator
MAQKAISERGGERMMDRDLHTQIRANIERELSGRTWSSLARNSGVPASTLSNQRSRPCFSLDVLARVAKTLGKDLVDLIPVEGTQQKG